MTDYFPENSTKIHRKAQCVAQILKEAGATEVFFVGGYVRDRLLGISSKDYDLEVYGLDYHTITAALSPHFGVNQVGKSFSVLKVDQQIDVALPRREVKTGVGHKEFHVTADSEMTFREAAARRDFTINAIGMRMDGTLCDPYDGSGDLRRKILRAPTEAFCEDPLRVLRGMQFAARFGMDMEPRTVDLCRRVLPEFMTLSEERIFTEWEKWAVKGVFPEKGLDILAETGWISCFPELEALVGTAQNPKYHPEGDVFSHTKMVCAEAAKLAEETALTEEQRAVLMFTALCHDFGKPAVKSRSKDISPADHARLHAERGAKIAETFLMKMKPPLWLVERVLPLITEHMAYLSAKMNPTAADVRHLSARLVPANIRLWELLCTADERGRGTGTPRKLSMCAVWGGKAREIGVYERPPEPILLGRHLLERGFSPGQKMGKMLKRAWKAQLDGEFSTLSEALEWLGRTDNG